MQPVGYSDSTGHEIYHHSGDRILGFNAGIVQWFYKGKVMQMIKNEIRNTKAEASGGVIMVLIWAVLIFLFLSAQGCIGPALFGVKEYQGSDGSVIKFITGADFTIGANGLDSVSNQRGIEPERYEKKGR